MAVTVLYLSGLNIASWVTIVGGSFGLIILGLAAYRDIMVKSIVVLYNLENDAKNAYSKLHDEFERLAACSKLWHVEATGNVRDSKYYAGATSLLTRKSISLSKGKIPFIKTNIDVPQIPVGKQFLAFMPDRLLVFESRAVGAVAYNDLEIDIEERPFIEDNTVPRDAKVIDYTWKYVNKKGGPDKRFKDNRQIPVALYEEIHFKSSAGLNELIQVSKTNVGESFRLAVQQLTKVNQDWQGKQLAKSHEHTQRSDSLSESSFFKKGIEAFKSGNSEEAIIAFNNVIRMSPEHQLAYYNRGCAYIKNGERKQAIEDLKIAAKLGHTRSQEILQTKGVSWV
jgi:tetratricopeptide (TPR) repeat protein